MFDPSFQKLGIHPAGRHLDAEPGGRPAGITARPAVRHEVRRRDRGAPWTGSDGRRRSGRHRARTGSRTSGGTARGGAGHQGVDAGHRDTQDSTTPITTRPPRTSSWGRRQPRSSPRNSGPDWPPPAGAEIQATSTPGASRLFSQTSMSLIGVSGCSRPAAGRWCCAGGRGVSGCVRTVSPILVLTVQPSDSLV